MKCGYDDSDLILYYYGEIDDTRQTELKEHLDHCKLCRERLTSLRSSLDRVSSVLGEPERAELKDFRAGVHEKLSRENGKRRPVQLSPKPVYALIVLLFVIFTAVGGIRFYQERQERKFIMDNYEMIVNMDLLEDIEILENLEDFGEV